MYGEWIRLNEKSRGGVFFGTDPSYGSDPTTRTFRAPSYSFYDNARWVTLVKDVRHGFRSHWMPIVTSRHESLSGG